MALFQKNRYVHAGPEGTVFQGQHPEDSSPRAVVAFSGLDGSWVDDRVTSGNNVNAYQGPRRRRRFRLPDPDSGIR